MLCSSGLVFFGHCLSKPHNYGSISQEVKTISAAKLDVYILFCKINVILFLFCFLCYKLIIVYLLMRATHSLGIYIY